MDKTAYMTIQFKISLEEGADPNKVYDEICQKLSLISNLDFKINEHECKGFEYEEDID